MFLPPLRNGRAPASSALPDQNSCVHAGEKVFERDQFHGPGIDLVQAALNLAVPGGLDFRFRTAIPLLKKVFNEPVHLPGRQLAGVFESFLGAAVQGEIVARNRLPNLKIEVNVTEKYGYTPLQIATLKGNRSMEKLLLPNGAKRPEKAEQTEQSTDVSTSENSLATQSPLEYYW